MSTRKTWRVRAFAGAVVGLLLAGGAAILGGRVAPGGRTRATDFVVAVFGGTFEKAWPANIIQAFERENDVRVRVVTGLSGEKPEKLRAQKDNPQMDVVTFDAPFALVAARGELLETLDAQRIPNLSAAPRLRLFQGPGLRGVLHLEPGARLPTRRASRPPPPGGRISGSPSTRARWRCPRSGRSAARTSWPSWARPSGAGSSMPTRRSPV